MFPVLPMRRPQLVKAATSGLLLVLGHVFIKSVLWRCYGLNHLKVPGNDSLCPSAPEAPYRIHFFHLAKKDSCLPHRNVCGIESVARTNPSASVHVHLVPWKPSGREEDRKFIRPGKATNCAATDVLKRLDNVHIDVESDPQRLLNDSRWQKMIDRCLTSPRSRLAERKHFMQTLPLVLLHRYGGISLDASIIGFRPLHCLLPAALTYVEETNLEMKEVLDFSAASTGQMKTRTKVFEKTYQKVASAFMAFDAGHAFLNASLEFILRNQTNASGVELKDALMDFCNLPTLSQGKHPCGIDLLDPGRFHIDQFLNVPSYFEETIQDSVLRSMATRFLAYVPGAELGIQAPPTCLYSSLARHYCPSTWAAVQILDLPYGF